MAQSFCARSRLLLVLCCVTYLKSANAQFGFAITQARFELLNENMAQLTEQIKINMEKMLTSQRINQSQLDNSIHLLMDLMKNNTEAANLNQKAIESEFSDSFAKHKETSNWNREAIENLKTINSDMAKFAHDQCKMQNSILVCDTSSSGDGWIVIQQRFGDSLDFNRSWSDYSRGFGTAGSANEFWLGLETIHQLTKTDDYELLIELKNKNGEYSFARYSQFVIDGEPEKYKVSKLGDFSGTAADIKSYSSLLNQPFSTYDRENDRWPDVNCGALNGGWWFYYCEHSLNARWDNIRWRNRQNLNLIRMLIREKTRSNVISFRRVPNANHVIITNSSFQLLQNRITQLTQLVENNTQAPQIFQQISNMENKISQLRDLVKNNTEIVYQNQLATQHHVENKLTNLTEMITRNQKLIDVIKNMNSEISYVRDPCRVQNAGILCITNSHGDRWIVIQQRHASDSPVNFNRSWSEYKNGFGSIGASTEFWWGLERIHQLTCFGEYEILIEVKDSANEYRFARYSEFEVEGESKNYRLSKLGGYSGTAGDANTLDSWNIPTGQMFSTYDRENDQHGSVNCAAFWSGGWWWNGCGFTLNERWGYTRWWAWKDEKIDYTRMMIRLKLANL